MTILPTDIPGCVRVEPTRHHDERGYFARTWDPETFQLAGIKADIAQCSVSFNAVEGTLRGMHYQRAPFAESKLVRCTRGAIFDVCLDLRPDSPTRGRWFGMELSAENGIALVIPEGCAHGLLTLKDSSEVFYMISAPYAPQYAGGIRYNDPAFGIKWPGKVRVINDRDATFPLVAE